MPRSKPLFEYRWIWTCCNCGDAGSTTNIPSCSFCMHARCSNCLLEEVKLRIRVYYQSKRGCTPPDYRPTTSETGVRPSSPFHVSRSRLRRSSRDKFYSSTSTTATSLAIVEETCVQLSDLQITKASLEASSPSASQGDLSEVKVAPLPRRQCKPGHIINKSVLGFSPDNATPKNISSVSPYSVPTSRDFSDTFSRNDIESSETDSDSNESSSDSESDSENGGYQDETFGAGDEDQMWNILESHVFTVLGNDLELASHLLPWIRAQVDLGLLTEDSTFKNAPADGTGNHDTNGNVSGLPPTHSNEGAPTSSPQHKRSRGDDEDENGGGRDSRGFKKPRTKMNIIAASGPHFACHYFKRDPDNYGAQAGQRYKTCTGPRPGHEDLHRLKQHLSDYHRLRQCGKCHIFFAIRHEFKSHERLESCPQVQRAEDHLLHKDGVDKSQWKEIDAVLKTDKRLTGSARTESEKRKWFRIWNILSPDVTEPPNPWYEHPQTTSNQLVNVLPDEESRLRALQRLIEVEVEQGNLPGDSGFQERFMDSLRRAFDLGVVYSRARQDLGLSPPIIHRPTNKPNILQHQMNLTGSNALVPSNGESSTVFSHYLQQNLSSNAAGYVVGELPPGFDTNIPSGLDYEGLQVMHLLPSPQLRSPTNTSGSLGYDDAPPSLSIPHHSLNLPPSSVDDDDRFVIPQLSENTAKLDLSHNQEPNDFLGFNLDTDFTELPSLSTTQEETQASYAEGMDLTAYHYDPEYFRGNGDLTAFLEQEIESPALTLKWKSNKDRNMGLSRP